MKTGYKIVVIFILLGVVFWISDAILDRLYFYHNQRSFNELVLYYIPVHELYIRISVLMLFIGFGVIIAYIMSKNIKIAELLKSSNKKIVQQNKFLNNVLNALDHPFCVINADNYMVEMANKSSYYEGEIHKNAQCHLLMHRSDKPCSENGFNCPIDEIRKTGKPVTIEHVHHDQYGNEIDTEIHAYPLFDDGKVSKIIEYSHDITNRKRMQKELESALEESNQRRKEISALLDSARAVLKYTDFTESAKIIFTACKSIIGATSGYVALLSPDGKNNDVLFLDPGGLPCSVDPSLPMPIRGLREEAYKTKKAVYCNDFLNSEWMKFIPEGHVALKNVLFAPLIIDEKAVGVIGIANKPEDFTSTDARMATMFGEFAALSLRNSKILNTIKENERFLRNVIDINPNCIFVKDESGKYILANKAITDLYGVDVDVMEGKTDYELTKIGRIGEEEALRFMEEDKLVIENQTPKYIREETFNLPDGSVKWFQTVKIPIKYIDGRKCVLGVATEITAYKLAEKFISEEKEKLSVTLHSIGDGVIVTDAKANVVLMNKVAEIYTGWNEKEAVGKQLKDVFKIIHEDTREILDDPVDLVLKTNKVTSLSNHSILISRDGSEYIINDSCAPIHDKDSNLIGTVLVFRDVTERRKMEADLQRMEKLESLGLLAGGIAHDFNNILTAILGNISLARIYEDPVQRDRRLEEAEKASLNAKDLTQQLLTFARGGSPIKELVHISDILKETASFSLRGSKNKCEFHIADDLLPAEVDKGQISQVISNIIINADQAMPDGGKILISAENVIIKEEDRMPIKQGTYIKISIKDEGIGIPQEHLQKIFDPYFTTKQKGTGLGLTITHSIIKNHDGHITVESELGVGTVFNIYLPACLKEFVKEQQDHDKISFWGNGRILIMDDDAMIRDLAYEIFNSFGFEVDVSADGNEAIRLYISAKESGNPYNLVIMDLTVPGGLGGRETIQKLIEIDPNVKAIVSSGYSTDPVMSNFTQYGFKGVITKPYNIKQVIEVIQKVINMT